MKLLLRLSREAVRYKKLYVLAILSTLCLTGVNLTAPKVLSAMTGIVEKGVTPDGMKTILMLTFVLVGLYLLRILFRFGCFLPGRFLRPFCLCGNLDRPVFDTLDIFFQAQIVFLHI